MARELIYTSAPKGLLTGQSGFTVVAATQGLARPLMNKLEALSSYEFLYKLSDERAADNPVNHQHVVLEFGGRKLHVLSRVGFCGADYTGRSNKIAHHILLDQDEMVAAGPAWTLRQLDQTGRFRCRFDGDPTWMPELNLRLDQSHQPDLSTEHDAWASFGESGWAGAPVRQFQQDASQPAYLIHRPDTDILPLLVESLFLMPVSSRWSVGFATYFNVLPAGTRVPWRGVVKGSSGAKEIRRFPRALVLDLTSPLGPAPEVLYAEIAAQDQPSHLEPVRSTTTHAEDDFARELKPIESAESAEIPTLAPTSAKIAGNRPPRGRDKNPDRYKVASGLLLVACLVFAMLFMNQVWKSSRRDKLSAADKGVAGQPEVPDVVENEEAAEIAKLTKQRDDLQSQIKEKDDKIDKVRSEAEKSQKAEKALGVKLKATEKERDRLTKRVEEQDKRLVALESQVKPQRRWDALLKSLGDGKLVEAEKHLVGVRGTPFAKRNASEVALAEAVLPLCIRLEQMTSKNVADNSITAWRAYYEATGLRKMSPAAEKPIGRGLEQYLDKQRSKLDKVADVPIELAGTRTLDNRKLVQLVVKRIDANRWSASIAGLSIDKVKLLPFPRGFQDRFSWTIDAQESGRFDIRGLSPGGLIPRRIAACRLFNTKDGPALEVHPDGRESDVLERTVIELEDGTNVYQILLWPDTDGKAQEVSVTLKRRQKGDGYALEPVQIDYPVPLDMKFKEGKKSDGDWKHMVWPLSGCTCDAMVQYQPTKEPRHHKFLFKDVQVPVQDEILALKGQIAALKDSQAEQKSRKRLEEQLAKAMKDRAKVERDGLVFELVNPWNVVTHRIVLRVPEKPNK